MNSGYFYCPYIPIRIEMKTTPTRVCDCYIIETEKHEDHRGFFQELYNEDWRDLSNDKIPSKVHAKWNHMALSKSKYGVIRGIHWAPYNKLVSCVSGKMFDVIVDLRPDSDTYLEWVGVWLSEEDTRKVFVPAGCGHGFFADDDHTVMIYFKDQTYKPGVERDWHYESFGINWPILNMGHADYVLSEKDKKAPRYKK
jgi:dTDP-4-dehydrorhamnose 3,5-epimerase